MVARAKHNKENKSLIPKIFKKKETVEVTAVIDKMSCKKAKDENVLICDITAKSGDEVIKDKIAINIPRLKYMEVKEEGKKPKFYFKEIEVD